MLLNINLREDIQKYFPNFEYFNCIESVRQKLDFSRADNLTGVQQESFLLYHILKQFFNNSGSVGLDLGCGQDPHWGCIGINDYCGNCHKIYGGKYSPHITSLVENIDTIFNENTFNFIVASHILEHVKEPIITFRKWVKLLRKDGIIILLCPDARYEEHKWDPTHVNFFSPDDFERQIINSNLDLLKTEELDTLNNKFSFNYIGSRI